MSESLMQILAMGGSDPEPKVSPELVKRLRRYSLGPSDITVHLNRYRTDAYVLAHPKPMSGCYLTAGKAYPIDEVGFSDDGKAIRVTITDDQQLRLSENVLLMDTLDDFLKDGEKYSEHSLVLILDEVRKLLADKWSREMIKETDRLLDSYQAYQEPTKFEPGDLVSYIDNMMVNGPLSRRGVAVVIECLDGDNRRRDSKTHEVHDLLIGIFDSDNDFTTMSVSARRLVRVPVAHVGSYKNPFMGRRFNQTPIPEDEPEESSES